MGSRTTIVVLGTLAFLGLFSGLLVWGLSDRGTREGPIITTNVGLIRGIRADSDDHSQYLGIPYALVNESNPFGPSTPHPGFDVIFEANEIATRCPQTNSGIAVGSLECLELDIYVPDTASPDNPLPVLVWIHGGAWILGSSSDEASGPQFFLKEDVIVVALNYRLGIFGFLCTDTPEAPGNQGLKDQVLALRWINENIAAFGGDPNSITAFGESAGGMSTNLHLYSSYEKLFDRAIIQSGPALSYWLMVQPHPDVPFRIAEYFNYAASDTNDALSYLSTLDPLAVVTASFDLLISNAAGTNQPLTKPCVERTFEGVESFLPEHPMNVRGAPKLASTPIIIGYTNQEFGFLFAESEDFFENSYQFTDQFNMGFPVNHGLDEALETIRHFYMGDEQIGNNVRGEIVNYGTDLIFGHSTHRMIDQFVEDGAGPVYSYVFSYDGGRNLMKHLMNVSEPGALHADELGYQFDLGLFRQNPITAEDQLVIDRMTKMWVNFAKYGDPTPEVTELLQVKWEPVTETTRPHLDINSQLTLQGRPVHSRMAFWDLFYRQYGSHQMWYQDRN